MGLLRPFFVLYFFLECATRSDAVFDITWNSSLYYPMGAATFGRDFWEPTLAQNYGGYPLLALRDRNNPPGVFLYYINGSNTWNLLANTTIEPEVSSFGIIQRRGNYALYVQISWQSASKIIEFVDQGTTSSGYFNDTLPDSNFFWDSTNLYAFSQNDDAQSFRPLNSTTYEWQISHSGLFSCITSVGPSVIQLCPQQASDPLVLKRWPDYENYLNLPSEFFLEITCSWHQVGSDDLVMYLLKNGTVMLLQLDRTNTDGTLMYFLSSHTFAALNNRPPYCFTYDNKYWLIPMSDDGNATYDRMTYFTVGDAIPPTSASNISTTASSIGFTFEWTFIWSSAPDPITACQTWLKALCLIPLQPTIYGNVALNSTVAKVLSESNVTIRGNMEVSCDAGIIYYVSYDDGVWNSGIVKVDGSVNANGIIDIQISGEISESFREFDLISFGNIFGTFSGNFTVTAATSQQDLKAVGYVKDNKYRARVEFAVEEEATQSAALKTPAIVGIAIGIVSLFIIVTVLVVILIVRQRRNSDNNDVALTPMTLTGVSVGNSIGKGAFGEVYLGTWSGNQVALKKMQVDNIDDFISEASTLTRVTHPNIVQYFGTCVVGECQYLVMEYLSGKSLHSLASAKNLDLQQLLDLSLQCAAGMMHLAEKQIIHRDLALRNVLIAPTDKGYVAKIADFGMSRLTPNGDYSAKGGVLPIRWCSPEVIDHNRFSIASDVWAFGVMMWELFSNARVPYGTKSNEDVVQDILNGTVLDPPESAPDSIRQLMTNMWSRHPKDRPTFAEISKVIGSEMGRSHQRVVEITVSETEEFYAS